MKNDRRFMSHPKKSDGNAPQDIELGGLFEATKEVEAYGKVSPGQMFGHYQIQEELGRGGMGIVYKALDTKLDRNVALKVIVHSNKDAKEVARLLQEATVMARLEHPNIVRIYDIGESPTPYFTMEYIQGASLAFLLEKRRISAIQASALLAKVAEAVHMAHRSNVVHRDIKPSNIMIGQNNEPRLMDFGLAKIKDERRKEVSLSRSGELLGTPVYMAPEQIDGEPGFASDVYSLGATLYECLTGRPPFQGDTHWNILNQIITQDVIPPRALNPDISVYLEAICLKCLNKEAKKRYPNARDLARDLKNFLSNRPVVARPYTRMDQAMRLVSRHKGISCAVLATVAVLIGFIGTLLYYNEKIGREKAAALLARDLLAKEKLESETLARAVIQSLQYAYHRDRYLHNDQEFLKPVRTVLRHLKRFNAGEEYKDFRGIVFGLSEEQSEVKSGIEEYNELLRRDPNNAFAYANQIGRASCRERV